MLAYKHYSFDLWLTLIKSNPNFKEERTRYFFNRFNYAQKTLNDVALIFRQVDLMCNSINEKTGKNISAEEMYLMVISTINDHTFLRDIDLEELYSDMEKLVFKFMPMVYSPETAIVLSQLKRANGNTISILSNTGFIKGKTLRKVLTAINLDAFFDFQLYSDEEGMSKPNRNFFKLMFDKIIENREDQDFKLNDVIHVGDNLRADIYGANSFGINSRLINSNNIPILSLI